MGMSTYVQGYKPADETWKKMKAVWDACREADIAVPQNVLDYFDGEYPGDAPGMEVSIKTATREYSADSRAYLEVDVTKLPAGVKFVRFCNSW